MAFSLYKIEIKKCWIMKKLYALKQVTRNKKRKKNVETFELKTTQFWQFPSDGNPYTPLFYDILWVEHWGTHYIDLVHTENLQCNLWTAAQSRYYMCRSAATHTQWYSPYGLYVSWRLHCSPFPFCNSTDRVCIVKTRYIVKSTT